jgi:hypothetical protein
VASLFDVQRWTFDVGRSSFYVTFKIEAGIPAGMLNSYHHFSELQRILNTVFIEFTDKKLYKAILYLPNSAIVKTADILSQIISVP